MQRIVVLDPTSPAPDADTGSGPDAGLLPGLVAGIRYDRTWRSFEWVIDEWRRELQAAGTTVRPWCAGNRIGEQGEHTAKELDRFADDVDLAVVGLGN